MPHRQSAPQNEPREKVCASCGRPMQWRAKWAQNWHEVKYCSDSCRRRGVTETDMRLEAIVIRLVTESPGAPITPEFVARTAGLDDWQPLYEPARRAARRLAHRGEVDIVQNGRTVDPGTVRGPFTIRAGREWRGSA